MHLPFSPEEFRRLLALAYLGEAVLNDWTPDQHQSAEQQRATDLLYELCQYAADTPNQDLVTTDEQTGRTIPSRSFQDSMAKVLSNYDDRVFWDELVERLAHRDLTAEYGVTALAQMSDGYRQAVERPFVEHYRTETERHGLEHLHVREATPPPAPAPDTHPRPSVTESSTEPSGERRGPQS